MDAAVLGSPHVWETNAELKLVGIMVYPGKDVLLACPKGRWLVQVQAMLGSVMKPPEDQQPIIFHCP